MEEEGVLSWTNIDRPVAERHPDWFWKLGIIASIVVIIAIAVKNLLFGILVTIAAATVGLRAKRQEREILISLLPQGIRIDKTLYPFNTLSAFWIEEDLPEPRLMLKSTRSLMPHLVVALPSNISPDAVRRRLQQKLPEEEIHYGAFDVLADYFDL
jgi:hypothetical protein